MSAGADRKVVFALLAIAALCLTGLGVSLYRAKGAELERLHKDLVTREKQLEDVRAKLTEQPKLEARYAELQTRLSVLEPALPDSAYMPTFLRQIERLAVGTDNRIVAIRPKAKTGSKGQSAKVNPETGEVMKPDTAAEKQEAESAKGKQEADRKSKIPYDHSSIEMKIEGRYSTILAFLDELRRFPKMIAVNDINFSPKSVGAETVRSPELTATLDLTAVIMKGGKDGTS